MIEKNPKKASSPNQAKLPEVIVFCTLAILGMFLVMSLLLTKVDWFYPTLMYGAIVYIAWQKYL